MTDFLLGNILLLITIPLFLTGLFFVIWMITAVNGFMRFEDVFYNHKKAIFTCLIERHQWLIQQYEFYNLKLDLPLLLWNDKPSCETMNAYALSVEERIKNFISTDELKALKDTNKASLQESLIEIEEHLQYAKRKFNSDVSYYNQRISSFPTKLIATWKHYEKKPLIDIEPIKWLER